MTTATLSTPTTAGLVGETVHYRDRGRCWAAAVVERGPKETAQLYVFPLPPNLPMPQSPGTFVAHGREAGDGSWHRLSECPDAPGHTEPPAGSARRRGGRSKNGA